MTRRRPSAALRTLLWVGLGLCNSSCVDPHWDAVRWPAQAPGLPEQPQSESPEAGVALRAAALEWEPEAVVVELEIHNLNDTALHVELAAILLAWNGLEYGVQVVGEDEGVQAPTRLELGPHQHQAVRLRYQLGRALTVPGAHVVLRGLSRGPSGDPTVLLDVPTLELPGIPTR